MGISPCECRETGQPGSRALSPRTCGRCMWAPPWPRPSLSDRLPGITPARGAQPEAGSGGPGSVGGPGRTSQVSGPRSLLHAKELEPSVGFITSKCSLHKLHRKRVEFCYMLESRGQKRHLPAFSRSGVWKDPGRQEG